MTGSPAPPAVFTRYVALGDSFTEGVGDPHPTSPNGLRGWADHVAVALAQNNPELRYANLAVRGRRMDEILAEQVQTAVMLEPDLVTVYAGMNDLLLVRNDIDAMMARYADGAEDFAADRCPRARVHGGRPRHGAAVSAAAGPRRGLQRAVARHRRRPRSAARRLLAVHRVSRSAPVGRRSHPPLAARP